MPLSIAKLSIRQEAAPAAPFSIWLGKQCYGGIRECGSGIGACEKEEGTVRVGMESLKPGQ